MKPFILREEYFGASVIRRKNLTFFFLNEWQTEFLKEIPHASIRASMQSVSARSHVPLSDLERFASEQQAKGMLGREGESEYTVREMTEDKQSLPRGILKSPLRLYFEVTRKCNLRCKNCFSSSGNAFTDELTHAEVLKTLDELRAADVLEARITGGEPTQRDGWRDIISHAKDLGLAVSLNTNGVYPDPNVRDDILRLGVDQVIISLDGNKDAHESLRGEGTYAKTLETIRYLSERANNVRINTILKEETVPHIPKLIHMAHDLGTEMCFILLRPVGRGEELFDAIPSLHALYDGVRLVKELRKQYPETKILTSYDVIQANAVMAAPDVDLTGCAAALRGCGISSKGRVECCGFLAELTDEYTPGNIRDHGYSVLSMWRNSPRVQAFRELNIARNKECVQCPSYDVACFGSCAAMHVYRSVNPRGKDPYCVRDRSCGGGP